VRLSFWHQWDFYRSGTSRGRGLPADLVRGATFTYVTAAAFVSAGTAQHHQRARQRGWVQTQATFQTRSVNLDAACNLIAGNTTGCAGRTVYIGFTVYSNA